MVSSGVDWMEKKDIVDEPVAIAVLLVICEGELKTDGGSDRAGDEREDVLTDVEVGKSLGLNAIAAAVEELNAAGVTVENGTGSAVVAVARWLAVEEGGNKIEELVDVVPSTNGV